MDNLKKIEPKHHEDDLFPLAAGLEYLLVDLRLELLEAGFEALHGGVHLEQRLGGDEQEVRKRETGLVGGWGKMLGWVGF